MALRTVRQNAAIEFVLKEYYYSLSKLRAHHLTKSLLTEFEAFEERIHEVFWQERELEKRRAIAQAMIEFADDNLDVATDGISNTILVITKNDRGSALYRRYFGDKPPSVLKRPVLGSQLETLRSWIPSLKASPHPQLQVYGVLLEKLVAEADKAIEEQKKVEQESKDFRELGEKKRLIDDFNSLRKETHDALDKIRRENPQENLPNAFADLFFRKSRTPSRPDLEQEIKEVRESIETMRQEITNKEARLQELILQKEKLAQEEAEEEQYIAELIELEKRAAELKEKLKKRKRS